MSAPPKYVQRIARLPKVFERLSLEPDGMRLDDLAEELGVKVAELREDLLAFYTADIGGTWRLSRPDVLEFVGSDGQDEDPGTAGIVRLVSAGASDLGIEYVDASELGLVYTAALALLDNEPDNVELGEAIDVLAETMFGESAGVPDVRSWNRLLPELQRAQREARAVRIVYSRAWDPGVSEREIDPYRLVQTRRGWEVDAGPPDDDGRLRSFLLSNIRSVEVLDRTFEPPADLDDQIAAQRATTTVRVLLPQSARWAADFYGEQVALVEDDEETVVVDVELLPPLDRRAGMLVLAAGEPAMVLEPHELRDADLFLAHELFVHHST